VSNTRISTQDYCAAVYAQSIANVSANTEHEYVLNAHCEINGEESIGLDLTIPIKGIMVSFSGNRQQALEQMQQFCRRHAQQRQSMSDSYHCTRR
jgi:hypothetical protein